MFLIMGFCFCFCLFMQIYIQNLSCILMVYSNLFYRDVFFFCVFNCKRQLNDSLRKLIFFYIFCFCLQSKIDLYSQKLDLIFYVIVRYFSLIVQKIFNILYILIFFGLNRIYVLYKFSIFFQFFILVGRVLEGFGL